MSLFGFSQTPTYITAYGTTTVFTIDLSTASDGTLYYFQFLPHVERWSMQADWTGVTGAGSLDLKQRNSSLSTDANKWSNIVNDLEFTITGASASDRVEGFEWLADYGAFYLDKGTLSAGTVVVTITIFDPKNY